MEEELPTCKGLLTRVREQGEEREALAKVVLKMMAKDCMLVYQDSELVGLKLRAGLEIFMGFQCTT